MPKLDKRIKKIRNSPNNATQSELASLLVSLGFEQRSGKGSHLTFKHPNIPGWKLIIPDKIKSYVVRQVLQCIDENQELWEDEG